VIVMRLIPWLSTLCRRYMMRHWGLSILK